MDLSIIIINYNTKKITTDCIRSIVKHTKGIEYEIVVIDNASSDGSVEVLEFLARKIQNLKLIKNRQNRGFGPGNNQGIGIAKGDFVLLLNTDTVIHDNVASEMISWMNSHPKVGAATCALKNKDGSLQGTGGYFPTLIRVFSWMTIQDLPFVDRFIKPFHPMREKSFSKGVGFYKKRKELDWITGAFFLARKKVIDKVGGFDEDYFMYTEETDLCYRIKKTGWKVEYLPNWSITHFGGASSFIEFSVIKEFEGVKFFYKKHYPKWQYPILRLFLKIGSLGRIVLFGLIKGKGAARIYAKAFQAA